MKIEANFLTSNMYFLTYLLVGVLQRDKTNKIYRSMRGDSLGELAHLIMGTKPHSRLSASGRAREANFVSQSKSKGLTTRGAASVSARVQKWRIRVLMSKDRRWCPGSRRDSTFPLPGPQPVGWCHTEGTSYLMQRPVLSGNSHRHTQKQCFTSSLGILSCGHFDTYN